MSTSSRVICLYAVLILMASALMAMPVGVNVKPAYASYSVIDNTSNLLSWQGSWYQYSTANAYGGSFQYTTTDSSSVSLDFYGSSITYLYSMAYNRGAVEVYINNARVDMINGYADDRLSDFTTPVPRRQIAKTYATGPGLNHIQLVAKPGDSASNRTNIELDAFIIDQGFAPFGIYDDNSSYSRYFGNWYTWSASDAYGGTYQYSASAGAGISFMFQGDTITWYFTRAANRGKALVTIDGENVNTQGYIDLYSSTTVRHQTQVYGGLGPGTHTISIINSGQKNPASTDYVIDADEFATYYSSSTYNRFIGSSYADAYTKHTNPYYPDFTAAGNDCTNFLSQMLDTGGFPYIPSDISQQNENDLAQWWYDRGGAISSKTWRISNNFITYESGRSYEFVSGVSFSALKRGDIMPLDLEFNSSGASGHDGLADHMRLVVGWNSSSPFSADYIGGPNLVTAPSYTLLIDQHTNTRWQVPWDYKTSAGDRMPYIHVVK